ncbi:putative DD41D transposase [Trichonephila clavipes]|nr:putative DD41D transposase [Trichonephila clavipes]
MLSGISVSSKTTKSRLADSCISGDRIGHLHIINTTLNVIKYIDTILEPKLLPSNRDLFTNNASLYFQQDSALCTTNCQVIYSQFGLAIHQNDHQARHRFVEWAQNEIAVNPNFHKRILFSDEAHFWLNGYVNKQNCRIWSEANPQVYVETSLHPEKLTVWCALWAGGILLQKR